MKVFSQSIHSRFVRSSFIFSLFVIVLFVVSACGDADVIMREENPFLDRLKADEQRAENEKLLNKTVDEKTIDEEQEFFQEKEFSLIEGQEKIVYINETPLSITLLGATNRSAGLLVDGRRTSVSIDDPVRHEHYVLSLLEVAPASVPVPRKSWVDVSVSKGLGLSQRINAYVGEVYELALGEEKINVSLEFVGRSEDVEKGRLHIGSHTIFAGEKEEEYWDDGLSLYVHRVYFNDANEHDLADGARVSLVGR